MSGREGRRAIDVFATLVLLFVVCVHTWTLYDKVAATRADHVLTFDLRLPTWPFFALAWVGDAAAVILIAVRAYRLLFHPDDDRTGGADRAGRRRERAHERRRGRAHRLRRAVRADAAARAGRHGDGARRRQRLWLIVGGGPALKNVGHTTARTVTDYNFAVIPLFLLMGAFATTSGMSRELFRAANCIPRPSARRPRHRHHRGVRRLCGDLRLVGRDRGDVLARRLSGDAALRLSARASPRGVIAAGGTLGVMIPPSTVFAVYGLITEQDVGKLFIAGVLPGSARGRDVHDHDRADRRRAARLSAEPGRGRWAGALSALRDVWATLLLFAFVIGGLYGGLFTATEAAGAGAGGAFLIGMLRGRLSRADILRSLLETTRTTAAVFTVLIGALLFGYFLDRDADAAEAHRVSDRARHRPLRRAGAHHADVSGARLPDGFARDDHPDGADHISGDQVELGFDPIWFGVIIVMTVELGLIHPPVGMNIFVIKSVVEDVKISTIFYGVLPVHRHRPAAAYRAGVAAHLPAMIARSLRSPRD